MAGKVRLLFREDSEHIRIHAEFGIINRTTGENLEILFCRDVWSPPNSQECEFTREGQIRPVQENTDDPQIVREILCSVRMRPDHAYLLSEQIMRFLQEMFASAKPSETGEEETGDDENSGN